MRRRPPRSTRTDTLFPYTTLFRSGRLVESLVKSVGAGICQASVIERGREIGVDQIAPKGPELIGFTRLETFAQIVNASDECKVIVKKRSDERRVGKEGVIKFRYRLSPYHEEKNTTN